MRSRAEGEGEVWSREKAETQAGERAETAPSEPAPPPLPVAAQPPVGSPYSRTVLRIFCTVASGTSSATPLWPWKVQAT